MQQTSHLFVAALGSYDFDQVRHCPPINRLDSRMEIVCEVTARESPYLSSKPRVPSNKEKAMLVKEAEAIIHSLSEPSKMPGYGYGLPTSMCITGSKLREQPNTVCSKCYACKGMYVFPASIKAQEKRYSAIHNPLWVTAMITVLKDKKVRYFRWHDSGDLQSVAHLKKIIKIAEGVPDMMFWLPTKEFNILRDYFKTSDYIPPNLCIRLSATLIDSDRSTPESWPFEVATCSTHDKHPPKGFECTAPSNGGKCGDCRACWDYNIRNVSYRRH